MTARQRLRKWKKASPRLWPINFMIAKTKKEISDLKAGGKILGEILSELARLCRPGKNAWEIDQVAEKMIRQTGGRPAFKNYCAQPGERPFPSTICASFNNELVHGIAKKEAILKNGDIFSIDIGMQYRGLFTDTAITVAVGGIPKKTRELMRVTKDALEKGIETVRPGISVAELGREIENFVKSRGDFGIVRDLVGHGVGRAVHEEPRLPNYYDRRMEKYILKPGMVLALEPMISLGDWRIKLGADGWTVEMADGSLCAHYEHTVIVTYKGCDVLTRRPEEI